MGIKSVGINSNGYLVVTEDNGEAVQYAISSSSTDPTTLDFSTLPTTDPGSAGKLFIDENGKVTVSAG